MSRIVRKYGGSSLREAEQIRSGQTPDNYLPPDRLSELEREHLKDAFKIIKGMQDNFDARYQPGRLG